MVFPFTVFTCVLLLSYAMFPLFSFFYLFAAAACKAFCFNAVDTAVTFVLCNAEGNKQFLPCTIKA